MTRRPETLLHPGHTLVLVERPGGGRALAHAVRFRHLRLRRAERHLVVAAHRHDIYEVLIILEGSYRCRIDGRAHGAEAGEVLVVRPGELHEDCAPGPLRLAAVACSALLQVVVMHIPLLDRMLKTTAPGFSDWLLIFALALIPVTMIEVSKLVFQFWHGSARSGEPPAPSMT